MRERAESTVEVRIEVVPGRKLPDEYFRYRYEVFGEELNVPLRSVTTGQKVARDVLDDRSAHVIAWFGGEIAGAQRLTTGSREDFGEYWEMFQLDRFAPYAPERIAVCSRIFIRKRYRAQHLATRVVVAGYRHLLQQGILFDVADIRPERKRWAELLGYRVIHGAFIHPDDQREHLVVVRRFFDRSLPQSYYPLPPFSREGRRALEFLSQFELKPNS